MSRLARGFRVHLNWNGILAVALSLGAQQTGLHPRNSWECFLFWFLVFATLSVYSAWTRSSNRDPL